MPRGYSRRRKANFRQEEPSYRSFEEERQSPPERLKKIRVTGGGAVWIDEGL